MNVTHTQITIRSEFADDELALRRLAVLDSATEVPAHPLLVAEIDGELRAVLSLHDGTVIADPFVPTASALELLRVRADALTQRPRARRLRSRAFRVPSSLRARATHP
jgi:hypothetical protein